MFKIFIKKKIKLKKDLKILNNKQINKWTENALSLQIKKKYLNMLLLEMLLEEIKSGKFIIYIGCNKKQKNNFI